MARYARLTPAGRLTLSSGSSPTRRPIAHIAHRWASPGHRTNGLVARYHQLAMLAWSIAPAHRSQPQADHRPS